MKLIYIKSTMEPKDYSTLRSLLKQTQGEKIAPYVFKVADTELIQNYLAKEKIAYELYEELVVNLAKEKNTAPRKEIKVKGSIKGTSLRTGSKVQPSKKRPLEEEEENSEQPSKKKKRKL